MVEPSDHHDVAIAWAMRIRRVGIIEPTPRYHRAHVSSSLIPRVIIIDLVRRVSMEGRSSSHSRLTVTIDIDQSGCLTRVGREGVRENGSSRFSDFVTVPVRLVTVVPNRFRTASSGPP
jgi:hypothetical protein